jgi:hypothetical protein
MKPKVGPTCLGQILCAPCSVEETGGRQLRSKPRVSCRTGEVAGLGGGGHEDKPKNNTGHLPPCSGSCFERIWRCRGASVLGMAVHKGPGRQAEVKIWLVG